MTRKKKSPAKLVSMTATCSKCDINLVLVEEELHFHGYDASCEMCGSHGSVTVSFTCPICKKSQEIKLNSW